MKKAFIYTQQTVKIDTLKPHPFFETVGSFIPTDKFLADFEYFGYMETPVVTPEGVVLTHNEDVLAATLMGDEEIDVVVIENASDEDLTRFIDFKSTVKHGKNRRIMYEGIVYLQNLLKSKEGKEFAKKLEGSKTRDKIANLLGVSPSSIQNLITIGKNNPGALDDIDNNKATSSKIMNEIKEEKNEANSNDEGSSENEVESDNIDTGDVNPTNDEPSSDDEATESDSDDAENMPQDKIATMMIIYESGKEVLIENKDGSCTLEREGKTVPLQYTSQIVKSEKKNNRNVVVEHDFMPRHHEQFHIGLTTRSKAA